MILGYAALNMVVKHQIIFHGKEEYVREDVTLINSIEGFWSYAKTRLYHYRDVPKAYFDLYLKEIGFRFNHRNEAVFRILSMGGVGGGKSIVRILFRIR